MLQSEHTTDCTGSTPASALDRRALLTQKGQIALLAALPVLRHRHKHRYICGDSPAPPATGVGSFVGGAATFWKTKVQLSLLALVRLLSVVKGKRGLKWRKRGPVSCKCA